LEVAIGIDLMLLSTCHHHHHRSDDAIDTLRNVEEEGEETNDFFI